MTKFKIGDHVILKSRTRYSYEGGKVTSLKDLDRKYYEGVIISIFSDTSYNVDILSLSDSLKIDMILGCEEIELDIKYYRDIRLNKILGNDKEI